MSNEEPSESPQISLRLVVRGPNIDPAELTDRLGCRPTRAYRKGDPVVPGLPRYHSGGMWMLEADRKPNLVFADQMKQLMNTLQCDGSEFCAAVRAHEAELLCMIEPKGPTADVEITPKMSEWIAERNLSFRIDVYSFTPAEAKKDLEDFLGALSAPNVKSRRRKHATDRSENKGDAPS